MAKPDDLEGDLDLLLSRAFRPTESPEEGTEGRRRGAQVSEPSLGTKEEQPVNPNVTGSIAIPPAPPASLSTGAIPPVTGTFLVPGQPAARARPSAVRAAGDSTSLAEVLTVGILLSDADGIVRNANSAARRIFGIRSGTLEGTRVIDLFEPADRGPLADLLDDAFRGRPAHEVDLSGVGRDASVHVKVTAAGRFDTQGRLRQVVWTVREAEATPLALDVRIHGSKVEVLAELGLELGREVGPLIMRMSDALISAQHLIDPLPEDDRGVERERLRGRLAEAMAALVRIQQVVAELDRFAIDTPLKPEPVDPTAILDRAKTLLGRSMRASRVRVRNEMDDPAPRVLADAPRLTEILVNLLRNGRNAIVRRFELMDAETTAGVRRLITVESVVKEPYVCLVVTNNGLPVSSADQDRIFLPSFAAHDPERTGFGLPETAALLKQMGGAIRCQSLGDQGTRFLLTLPKAD